ncbi:hypothetical protein [Tunturiibacter gelidiferens]|uniref:hypothetical protein n=1 Tax=Tunturiibacter gelidiferens TaxID=3069689 RepID=UPI003D9BAD14
MGGGREQAQAWEGRRRLGGEGWKFSVCRGGRVWFGSDRSLGHKDKLGRPFEPDVVFERGEDGGALGTGAYTEGNLLEADDLSGENDRRGPVLRGLPAEAHVIFGGHWPRGGGGSLETSGHVRLGACRAKVCAGVSEGDTFIDFGSGDEGEESERKGSDAAFAVGVVEGDGDAGSFVLFCSLLELEDVTDNHRSHAQMACGLIPIDSCFGEDRGSDGKFAGVDGREEFGLKRGLWIDGLIPISAWALSGRGKDEEEGRA